MRYLAWECPLNCFGFEFVSDCLMTSLSFSVLDSSTLLSNVSSSALYVSLLILADFFLCDPCRDF